MLRDLDYQSGEFVTMKKSHNFLRIICSLTAACGGIGLCQFQAEAQDLNIFTGEHEVHVFPSPSKAKERASAVSPFTPTPLVYHGGPVMTTATTYAIFWAPATLQTGAATSLPAHYQNVQTALLSLYPGHGIGNNNTQYYQTSSGLFRFTDYIQNSGNFGGSYVDNSPYPASACTDSVTPGNCLSDAQIQAEVQKVMTIKGWTGGLNHIFFVYTSSGEGSCSGSSCAYTDYCGYHGYFNSGTTPVLYSNMPYADTNHCQVPGTPSPNSDPAADAAATVTSHELTEAITDPELNAWYSSGGDEIGDLCAWNYGPNTWDGGKANQSWPEFIGLFILNNPPIYNFELQQEYNNHTDSCVQVGP